jgi:hypothetical protein
MRRIYWSLLASLIIGVLVAGGVWLLAVAMPWKTGESHSWLSDFSQRLYDSSVGAGIRQSIYVFPIIEGIHLLGIALSVGTLCWFDLRLLGLALRDEPVSKVWKQVMPLALAGFIVMFISGVLLFWAEAATAYHSIHFWLKLAFIAMAGVNAAIFELKTHTGIASWDKDARPPFPARMAGLLSLVFWTLVIVTGRTMAYTF